LDQATQRKQIVIGHEALTDRNEIRRAVAGCILASRGNAVERAKALPLLRDRSELVRLRVAQGFLARDDRGIPTLIELLSARDPWLGWQAEELLLWRAGSDAPKTVVGPRGKETTQQAKAAWKRWWAKKEKGMRRKVTKPPVLLVFHIDEDPEKKHRQATVCIAGSSGKRHAYFRVPASTLTVRFVPAGELVYEVPGEMEGGILHRDSWMKQIACDRRVIGLSNLVKCRWTNSNEYLLADCRFIVYRLLGGVERTVDLWRLKDRRIRLGREIARVIDGGGGQVLCLGKGGRIVVKLDLVTRGTEVRETRIKGLRDEDQCYPCQGGLLHTVPQAGLVRQVDHLGKQRWETKVRGVRECLGRTATGNYCFRCEMAREGWLAELSEQGKLVRTTVPQPGVLVQVLAHHLRLGIEPWQD
jgi:hypothetical protein